MWESIKLAAGLLLLGALVTGALLGGAGWWLTRPLEIDELTEIEPIEVDLEGFGETPDAVTPVEGSVWVHGGTQKFPEGAYVRHEYRAPGPEDEAERVVWIYLPEDVDTRAPGSLPILLAPPARNVPLCAGAPLLDAEATDHQHYLALGFAVVGFSVDGAPEPWDARSSRRFHASREGLENVARARALAAARYPALDDERVFIAGQGAGGRLALVYAAHADVEGVLAYAPMMPLEGFHVAFARLAEWSTGSRGCTVRGSPWSYVNRLDVPTFLFHAEGDGQVDVEMTRAFARRLGARAKLVTVPGGDHFQSTWREGLPRGLNWLEQRLVADSEGASASPAPSSDPEGFGETPDAVTPVKGVVRREDGVSTLPKGAFVRHEYRAPGPEGEPERVVWIYLPADVHARAPGSLPLILVPPEGSVLPCAGARLTKLDTMINHPPYLALGFAVVSFSIDGAREVKEFDPTAPRRFHAARDGLDNVARARALAIARYPALDDERVFIAGRGKAGRLALEYAAQADVEGVLAYAPKMPREGAPLGSARTTEEASPYDRECPMRTSPWSSVNHLKTPTFLFQAEDDEIVDIEMTRALARSLGPRASLVTIPGDGPGSTILEGIPRGLNWLEQRLSADPEPASTAPASTAPSSSDAPSNARRSSPRARGAP